MYLCVAILYAAVCAPAMGQDAVSSAEILTNDKVIAMVKAGLPSSVIVNKIRTSKTNFNTSTEELIRLKQETVAEEVINAMINPAAALLSPTEVSGYPKDIGVYLKKNNEWIEVQPEVVNWKTGGVLKSMVSLGVVKGDVNGHVEGNQSRTRTGPQIEFIVIAPEGVSISEYQLLRLNQHTDNREFRTLTGGIFHAKGGATPDLIPFEGQKLASRTFSVALNGLKLGEYGLLPPGVLTQASGAATLGKMYTFGVAPVK
jgi:hypothetical protein